MFRDAFENDLNGIFFEEDEAELISAQLALQETEKSLIDLLDDYMEEYDSEFEDEEL